MHVAHERLGIFLPELNIAFWKCRGITGTQMLHLQDWVLLEPHHQEPVFP